jgi:hypothetical protein
MVLVGPQRLPGSDIKIICSDEWLVEFYRLPSLPLTSCCCCPVLKVPLRVLQLSLDLSSSLVFVTTNPGRERERSNITDG